MEPAPSSSTHSPGVNGSSYDNYSNNRWRGPLSADSARLNDSVTLSDHFHTALLGVFLGSLSLITIIMNLLVLYAVRRDKSLHTVGNLYIVSLSVADLIVGATVMPLNVVYLMEDEWKLGHAVCQFWLIMDYVASTASIFSLFILCLDRYRSVRQPLKYLKYRTRGKASVMISGAWLLSMMWIIPILGWRLFTHVDIKPEQQNQCDTDFRFVTWFKVITAIFNFYVPSILMLWFYIHIFMAVRQHLRDRERIIHPTDSFAENEGEQNVRTPRKSQSKSPRRVVTQEASAILYKKRHQNTVDHIYSLEKTEKSKTASSAVHRKLVAKCRQTTLLTLTAERLRMKQNVKTFPSTPKKPQPRAVIPLRKTSVSKCSEHGQRTMNTCHVTLTNSISGVCDINQVTDMQKYTSALYANGAPCQALPWNNQAVEDAKLDPDSAATLRQTWQKFVYQSRQRMQSLRVHKEHKAARQLGFIIAAYFLCWIPYFIAFMVTAFCRDCVHHDLHMFTIWLGYINSTLNPFIYPLCNSNFKRIFKNILNIGL
ncbi:histamine H1 receptor [Cynoglossus semilaevis]|uniref:Histamine H1 receptor n=1 Tax=Cynoglossus semilaevis TaxID=244447 RepID=A0A3P8X453_CYNSE|nr:histamine H1 receptor [Cynoglossus semilaevis]